MSTNASALATQLASIEPIYLILGGAAVVLLLVSMAQRVRKGRGTGRVAAARGAEPAGEPFSGVLLASRPEHDMRGAARTTVWSLVVHAWVIAALVWATMSLGTEAEEPEEVVTIFDAVEEPPPPPPPPPPPQEIQEAPPVEVAKGFQTLTVPDIVPPDIPPPQIGVRITEADFSGVGTEGGRADGKEGAPPQSDLLIAPTFTPYTVAPELKNSAEVQRVLTRNYPPLLRDAGIGGNVLLWFLIDENGKVVKTTLKESSGHAPLDEAAAKVASVMVFSPAINRDRKVPVWVAIPIQFTTK
jgi:periplasmic protein TonB